MQTTSLREWRNSGHVKCRYRVIGRLISNEVLWKSFHPNTPIKGELQTMFIILQISYIIVHYHISLYQVFVVTLSILWIQVTRHSSLVKCLSGSESSLALLSGQDSPTLSNLYLRLQGSPILLSSQLFQNYSKHVHTSDPIVSGNPQRVIPSSLALLVSDFCYLVSTP